MTDFPNLTQCECEEWVVNRTQCKTCEYFEENKKLQARIEKLREALLDIQSVNNGIRSDSSLARQYEAIAQDAIAEDEESQNV